MKSQIQILHLEKNEGVSKKTGNAYSMRTAHCILFTDDGAQNVGVLDIPKAIADDPAPGRYEVEFGIGVDYQTRKVGARVVGLKLLGSGTLSPSKLAGQGA